MLPFFVEVNMVRPLLFAFFAAALAWFVSYSMLLRAARADLDQTLLLTTRAVGAEIDRLRALPAVAAEDARVRLALAGKGSLDSANEYLEMIADHAGADELFLIDASGKTIAASNWKEPGSFVGQNYAFRPYFQDALAVGKGQLYAIGVTTGIPGYFLSSRVEFEGKVGVMVVKLDLRPLQQTWRVARADVGLADEFGMVFLSARPEWQYRPLVPLPEDILSFLIETRAYEGVEVTQVEPLFTRPPEGANAQGDNWIARLGPVAATRGQVFAARPMQGLYLVALGWAALAAMAGLAVAASLKNLEQRRQIIAMRLSQSEKLEAMVVARTAELALEVEARTQAETDLRTAQEVMIHTEKMAAMGRMSAAIVHEISQPLAAMEASLSAAEIGLGTDDRKTSGRIVKARDMIRRMQRTTKHLKSFARKDTVELSLIDLRAPLRSAIELVLPRARAVGAKPLLELPDEAVYVMAGNVRIQQVVTNLVLNALDALETTSDPKIRVELEKNGVNAVVTVTDNGTGIKDTDLPRVSEPFFSTKQTGEGLGLGLSICRVILADFSGELDIHSVEQSGTQVTVTLPLAAQELKTA